MKKRKTLQASGAALAIFFILLAFLSPPLKAAELVVVLEGVRNVKGLVRLALYDREDLFPKQGKGLVKIGLPAQAPATRVVFPGLAEGRYALAVFHDEDSDNEFDRGFLGLPQEGFGFSNDAPVFISAPAFDAAAFELKEPTTELVVHLSYWMEKKP